MNKQIDKDHEQSGRLSSQKNSMDPASATNRVPANEKPVDSCKPKRDDVCLFKGGIGYLTYATRKYRRVVEKAEESKEPWSKKVYEKIRMKLGNRTYLVKSKKNDEWLPAAENTIHLMTLLTFKFFRSGSKRCQQGKEAAIGEHVAPPEGKDDAKPPPTATAPASLPIPQPHPGMPFYPPAMAQRSRLRILDNDTSTTPKQLQFVTSQEDEDESNNTTITVFGRPIEELRSFFESIIVHNNLLTNEKVTRALNTGFLVEFMGNEGNYYGPLAALVKESVQQLKDRLQSTWASSTTPTHGDEVLLWMLTQKDTKDKDHQRSHLCELLVYLAETASQQHRHDDFLLYAKDLTLFLLKNVLMSTRNESPTKYQRLLKVLQLPAPHVSRTQEPDWYRTHGKKTILERILGDNSMESVITLYDSKFKAFSTGSTPEEYRKNPKLLPKRAQTPRVESLWATDDFSKDNQKETDLNEEVAYFTGQPLVVKTKTCTGSIKSDAPTSTGIVKANPSVAAIAATTQDTTITLDDAERAKVISCFDRMKACAEKKGELTMNDVNDMCGFFLDPLAKAVVMGESTPEPVNPSAFRPVSPSMELDISPLTVESVVFEHQEGITVTEEGLRHCFQRLYALRNHPDCQHLKSLENDEWISQSWRSDQLTSNMDPVVAGQKWTIEDFDIMGIIDGGNFGRLLDLRNGSKRICGKIKFFFSSEYSSFCGELLESTKVKQRNIAR